MPRLDVTAQRKGSDIIGADGHKKRAAIADRPSYRPSYAAN